MKKSSVFILFIFQFISNVFGQVYPSSFTKFENSFKTRFDSIKTLHSDSAIIEEMQKLQNNLVIFLEDPISYKYPLDSLKYIGKVKSPDEKFRIISWNIFINKNSFKNYCIIQLKPEKGEKCKIIVLYDNTNIDSVGDKILTSNNWYGALYYKIIPSKISGKTSYILLGLDSYSPYISKKVIDAMYFENDNVYLGVPMFSVSKKNISRMIFSYSARVSMMLNYDENIKTIVFDHLSPSETKYTGQFEYYGPDFSYDGFEYSKNQWIFVEDVRPNKPVRK